MKYHVHVYRVAWMIEYDIDAKNKQEAREKGLKQVRKKAKIKKSDCNFFALSFRKKK